MSILLFTLFLSSLLYLKILEIKRPRLVRNFIVNLKG